MSEYFCWHGSEIEEYYGQDLFLKSYFGMLCLFVNHVRMYRLVESTAPDSANWTNQIRSAKIAHKHDPKVWALLAIEMIYMLNRWKSQINNKTSANLGPCDFFIQFLKTRAPLIRNDATRNQFFFSWIQMVPHTSYTIHGQIFIDFSITCCSLSTGFEWEIYIPKLLMDI